jgi:hypothetical protein
MNLASSQLLEYLYNYLNCIKKEEINERKYISTDGVEYPKSGKLIGKIAVVITMNGASVSSSRTSLNNIFLSLIHSFIIPNYNEKEINELINNLLENGK